MDFKKYEEYIKDKPDWYWIHGLHDAFVIESKVLEFPFDFDEYRKGGFTYTRNALSIKLDSSEALS